MITFNFYSEAAHGHAVVIRETFRDGVLVKADNEYDRTYRPAVAEQLASDLNEIAVRCGDHIALHCGDDYPSQEPCARKFAVQAAIKGEAHAA